MEGRDFAAAFMTALLVAASVVLATMLMNRIGDLLSVPEAPETRASAA